MTPQSVTSSGIRAAGAGLMAGVLLALTLPPWGWWPLGPLGVALLALAWRGLPFRRRMLCAASTALGFHALGLWWMTQFSVPGYVAATLIEIAILAGALLLVPAGRGRLVALPAALVVGQAVQGHWPLGGVPVDGIALGQAAGPLALAARLGGEGLLVALVGAAGCALAALLAAGGKAAAGGPRPVRPLLGGAATLAVVVLLAVAGTVAPAGSERGTLRVAAVQGGGVRGLRAIDAVPERVFEAQLEASAGVRPPVDLVVWPEDVIDVPLLEGSEADQAVAALARRLQATVVAGVVEDVGDRQFRNAAVAWGPDGAHEDRYEKVHRVPFGEYIPARGLVSRLADVSAVPRDAIAGRGPGILETSAGRLGVVISYEVFFADRARAAVRAGGTVLLVPTNASSYTTGQVPGQELAAARLRAIETGRAVVQAAPTGYSAVVDPDGRVRARSRLGPPAVIERTVAMRTGQTIATRLGEWPLTLAAALVLAAVWARRRRFQGLTPRDGAVRLVARARLPHQRAAADRVARLPGESLLRGSGGLSPAPQS